MARKQVPITGGTILTGTPAAIYQYLVITGVIPSPEKLAISEKTNGPRRPV